MTCPPETIDVETTLAEAYLVLASERLTGAPIVDLAGHLVGVFSTTDLLADLAPVLDPSAPPDAAVLERLKAARIGDRAGRTNGADEHGELVTCGEDATLVDACRLMVRKRVHRVIVVDELRSPVAILSAIDVVRAVAALDEVCPAAATAPEEEEAPGGSIEASPRRGQDGRPGL